MIKVTNCPNCESTEIPHYKTLYGERSMFEIIPGVRVEAAKVVRYSECQRCKLIFQNPRLSDKELDMYCGKEKRAEAKTDLRVINKYLGKVKTRLDIGLEFGSNVPNQKFDLVTFIDVLERVAYPLKFLRKMIKFVKKKGFVVIQVPRIRTVEGSPNFEYLSFFETDVLRLMCQEVGLTVLATEFTPDVVLVCRLL